MSKKRTVRRTLINEEYIEAAGETIEAIIDKMESLRERARQEANKKGYVITGNAFYIEYAYPYESEYYCISVDTEETVKEMEERLKRSESAKKSAAKRKEEETKRELKELERLKKKYEKHQQIPNEKL